LSIQSVPKTQYSPHLAIQTKGKKQERNQSLKLEITKDYYRDATAERADTQSDPVPIDNMVKGEENKNRRKNDNASRFFTYAGAALPAPT